MLTVKATSAAKPREKPYKLFDERGLYLEVRPNGKRWWRFRYRYANKEKLLSFGVYPEVTLTEARDRRDAARSLLRDHVDPSAERQSKKLQIRQQAENSFEKVARAWYGVSEPKWEPAHATRTLRRLEQDIFPWLGKRPISEISAPELIEALRRIEKRGANEVAYRALQSCSQVFRFAIAEGKAERNPAAELRGSLRAVVRTQFPSITDPNRIGELLRAMDGYNGSFAVRCALKLAPLTFVRPGELRKAEWAEFDLSRAEWRIPATKMKSRAEHIVPLSSQAVEVLKELKPLTGEGGYLFPSNRGRGRHRCPRTQLTLLCDDSDTAKTSWLVMVSVRWRQRYSTNKAGSRKLLNASLHIPNGTNRRQRTTGRNICVSDAE